MVKSRRLIKRTLKTKRVKRGGRKNENYNPIAVTQMQGGQTVAPRPAPASGLNIYTIDIVSLRDSLQSFGDAVYAFKETARTDADTFNTGYTPNVANPLSIPTTGVTPGTLYALFLEQKRTSNDLTTAANNVYNAFYNTSTAAANGIPPGGIYKAIYGSTAIFVPTPIPAPAPAGATVVAAAPAAVSNGNTVSITSEANLRSALQAFGDKIASFKVASQAQVNQVNSPDLSSFPARTETGPAYSAFLAQQTAANDLVSASDSVMTAFVGSPSIVFPGTGGTTTFDGVNGTRGLYRAILGNTENFTPTAPAPGP